MAAIGAAEAITTAGFIAILALISPYRETRERARESLDPFVEIYVACPPWICEQRDVKGMWAKAKRGEIKDFTGLDGVYEFPLSPEITVQTGLYSAEECVEQILAKLREFGYIGKDGAKG